MNIQMAFANKRITMDSFPTKENKVVEPIVEERQHRDRKW